MTLLYAYSLIPVLSVSLLLFLSLLLYGRWMRGLMFYCAAIAVWSAVLLSLALPGAPAFTRQLAQVGAFVSASFVHAAFDFTRQRNYALVWLVYAVALAITLVGAAWPGLLYSPVTFEPGPAFWPAHILGLGAVLLPVWHIVRAYPSADAAARRQLRTLGVSGTIGFLGAWINSIALAHGVVVPYPMLMVLGSLFLLTGLLRQIQQAAGKRLLERSLVYAAMTAFLWAGFLFGVMTLMQQPESQLQQYRIGAFFLLCMAALAFEPVRLHVQGLLSRLLLSEHVASHDLAEQLAQQEQRADQAERLAELGTFVSAVAHEIRNPLGVIAANVRLLETGVPAADVAQAIRSQVERASTFVDDLLRYGRPRPLELRLIDLPNTIRLAHSAALQVGPSSGTIDWHGLDTLPALVIEADQGQVTQVFTILFSNALHALDGRERSACSVAVGKQHGAVWITVDDNGPGIPDALLGRLFQPFVTGRKREGTRSGTGLGLAIAKGIVERHHGTLVAGRSPMGGAQFRIELPTAQRLIPARGGDEPKP